MNILVIGGGGREHALAWKIGQSPLVDRVFCAPGNAGIAEVATCVALDVSDHDAVAAFCTDNTVALVVIGPEAPLVDGLADSLNARSLPVFGPSRAAAALEGSKGFTKDLCREASIPTAAYARFTDSAAARAYVADHPVPVVIKADGLAAGKGVTIAATRDEAVAAIDACFDGAFGAAGAEVIIEAFLEGEEASVFCLVDGAHILPLATAQDHKRVGDGDTGPNTGGMGAYAPAPVMTDALLAQTIDTIIQPTVDAMRARGTPFRGVLYAGLMLTTTGPQLIEYNVRFGDPECQALMLRLDSDIVPALHATAAGSLEGVTLSWNTAAALTVVAATTGYPGAVQTGSAIKGLEAVGDDPDVVVFHAATARADDGGVIATGGRVLGVTARGATVGAAQAKAYAALEKLDWPNGFWRRDIGWRAIADETGADT